MFLRCGRLPAARLLMTTNREKTFSVGRYLVSPLTTLTPAGTYAPSVSIRSGQGRSTHDRVFRLEARFARRGDARRHAADHGRRWIRETGAPLVPIQP